MLPHKYGYFQLKIEIAPVTEWYKVPDEKKKRKRALKTFAWLTDMGWVVSWVGSKGEAGLYLHT